MKLLKVLESLAKKKEDDKTGIKQPFWFYASEIYSKKAASSKKEVKPEVGEPEPKPLTKPDPSAEDQVNQILLDTPQMSAATLVNTLKAKGLAIVDQKDKVDQMKQEADQLGANPAVLRAEVVDPKKKKDKKYKGKQKPKEVRASESLRDRFVSARFMETEGGPSKGAQVKNKFKVALIQEGLGNLRDGFYYSANAIESAITAFEGKKCYADHPARSEEQDRPERSVRDIIGHFENVHVEENDDGSKALCADLIILPDAPYEWARSLVRQAVEYSTKYADKDFVGLSINASGDAEALSVEDFMKEGNIPESCKPKLMKAIEEGLTQVRVVNTIRDAISTDLVTEAGAKGRVLEIMENNKEADKMAKKDILPKEAEDEAMKMKHESEDEAQDAPTKDDEHSDEEQDKKLILDMIKKHMGDDGKDMGEEEEEAAHKACEAYKEMGYEAEDAAKCAAHAMKLAKHMAAKKEAEKHEAEDEAKHEAEDEAKHESEDEAKKEAAAMKLEARIAMLESELKKRDMAVYLDKKLSESKLPRSVTDKIRTKKLRNEKEVDEAIKIYVEAFKEAGISLGGESVAKKSDFFVTSTEKTPSAPSKDKKISFGDMLK